MDEAGAGDDLAGGSLRIGRPPRLIAAFGHRLAARIPVPGRLKKLGISCCRPLPIRSARPICFRASRSSGQFSAS
jgi:hypothetical protein